MMERNYHTGTNTYSGQTADYPEPMTTMDQTTGYPITAAIVEGELVKNPIYEEGETFNKNSKWNDILFFVLFLGHVIGIFSYGGYNMVHFPISFTNATISSNDYSIYVVLSSFLTLFFSYLILVIIKSFPEEFIKMTNVFLIVFNFLWSIFCIIKGLYSIGVILFFQACIILYWYYIAQPFIHFSATLLKTSIKILNGHKAVFLIPLIGLLFMAIYSVFTVFAIHPSIDKLNNNYSSGYLILLFIFFFLWTQQVISNTVHVTVAGVVGKWYYKNEYVGNIVWKAFIRSISTSFGSICFGSLIVAIIKFIHFLVRIMRKNDNECVYLIAEYIIWCLESILEYFNEYSYSYVGIYGLSYIESAKKTWALAKNNFITALFNDNLIYPVLQFSVFFASIVTGLVCWLLLQNLNITLTCAILAFSISAIIMNIVHSSVVSLFVCCLEDLTNLQLLSPELFILIQEKRSYYQQQNNNEYFV